MVLWNGPVGFSLRRVIQEAKMNTVLSPSDTETCVTGQGLIRIPSFSSHEVAWSRELPVAWPASWCLRQKERSLALFKTQLGLVTCAQDL